MQFSKMNGIGNDYIFVNCFSQPVPESPSQLAKIISHRHFGIGSDGLILILPSTKADVRMRIWNADGSEAEMCGNGLRCVAKFFHDRIQSKKNLLIETHTGVVTASIGKTLGNSTQISICMGKPILDSAEIPTTLQGNPLFELPLKVGTELFSGHILSMGNPHCVLFVEELTDSLVETVGPALENHEYFPERINVEFVQVLSTKLMKMRVWERGSGETLACGSGASAAYAVASLKGLVDQKALVQLPGGDLELSFDEDGNILLNGPASWVFDGEWIPDKASSHGSQTSQIHKPTPTERVESAA